MKSNKFSKSPTRVVFLNFKNIIKLKQFRTNYCRSILDAKEFNYISSTYNLSKQINKLLDKLSKIKNRLMTRKLT